MTTGVKTSLTQNIFRVLLAAFMIYAGFSHLSFNRIEFQTQVPDWFPMNKDLVVILSGIVEMLLGLALLFWKKQRAKIGWGLAIFFVLVFPGNLAQYIDGKDSFGALDSDRARLIRLFFQPLLITWALWSSGAWKEWRNSKNE